MEGTREDKESWQAFLKHLKDRGLRGVNLIISDKCIGLVESIPYFFPESMAKIYCPFLLEYLWKGSKKFLQSDFTNVESDSFSRKQRRGIEEV